MDFSRKGLREFPAIPNLTMTPRLNSIEVSNWKSLREIDLKLEAINVLIGKNGSGKSNLIHFFNMLNRMMTGSLQQYIGQRGGASALLHYGPKTSMFMDGKLNFLSEKGSNDYSFRLVHGAPDTLIFASEKIVFTDPVKPKPYVYEFGSGHKESQLTSPGIKKGPETFIRGALSGCRSFQFHDTTDTAHIRQTCAERDNDYLKNNGGNVAAILLRLKNEYPNLYGRIVRSVRTAIPAFGDFILEPSNGFLRLEWLDSYKGERFGTHHLSDGSLRIIALHTLLALPQGIAPTVIIIDEPELGLFPLATDSLAEAIRFASEECQIILATQSNRLVRYLNLDSLVCCSWKDGETEMQRLSPTEEYFFMDDYTLGDYVSR
jgi:predicted ATPase